MSSSKGGISTTDDTTNNQSASDKTETPQKRRNFKRVHRACDRCKLKKSRCDGQHPCDTCVLKERTCVFSALRRRDIRKWHCRTQDAVDEAIQRLFKACVECSNFPGIPPVASHGVVTTQDILEAMGFDKFDVSPVLESEQPTDLSGQEQSPSQSSQELTRRHRWLGTADSSYDDLKRPRNQSTSSTAQQSSGSLHFQSNNGIESDALEAIQQKSPAPPLLDMREQFDRAMDRQTTAKQQSYEDQLYAQWQSLTYEGNHHAMPAQPTDPSYLPQSNDSLFLYGYTASIASHGDQSQSIQHGYLQSPQETYRTHDRTSQ